MDNPIITLLGFGSIFIIFAVKMYHGRFTGSISSLGKFKTYKIHQDKLDYYRKYFPKDDHYLGALRHRSELMQILIFSIIWTLIMSAVCIVTYSEVKIIMLSTIVLVIFLLVKEIINIFLKKGDTRIYEKICRWLVYHANNNKGEKMVEEFFDEICTKCNKIARWHFTGIPVAKYDVKCDECNNKYTVSGTEYAIMKKLRERTKEQ